jgi:ribonuclease HI
MDLTYATIPSSKNSFVKLHMEKERKFHVEDPNEPMNEFVYHVSDIGNYAICSNFLAPVKEKFKEEKIDEVWKMHFDGAHSRSGEGARIVLTSPSKQSYYFAFRLEFEATNNVVEYEALLPGLEIAKDMGIKALNLKGDSDFVILQVKNKFACKSERLKKYTNSVWDTMEFFDALDLISVPKEHNSLEDKLTVSVSTFQPSKELLSGQGKMEVIFRPSCPDNMDHWQVFNDDKQILRFMNNLQEFSGFRVGYKEGHKYKEEEEEHFENPTPKGLIKLEQIFDRHDSYKKKETIKPGDYIEVNIKTTEDPKMIKIGKGTSEKRKKRVNKSSLRV